MLITDLQYISIRSRRLIAVHLLRRRSQGTVLSARLLAKSDISPMSVELSLISSGNNYGAASYRLSATTPQYRVLVLETVETTSSILRAAL
jgi:hypothetical protein